MGNLLVVPEASWLDWRLYIRHEVLLDWLCEDVTPDPRYL
jgi:hypothetical protein